MRNNKTLLKILVDNFDRYFTDCICDTILELYCDRLMSLNEALKLQRFIEKNKPSLRLTSFPYWWEQYSKLPRKRFLNKLLKKYSDEN
jgi:hypothetical protein